MDLHTGKRLLYLRKKRKKSQQWLADSTGITRSLISELENGRKNITYDQALQFSNVFQEKMEYFLDKQTNKTLNHRLQSFSSVLTEGNTQGAEKYVTYLTADIPCPQQEFESKLLCATYFYQTRQYHEAIKLEPYLRYCFQKIEKSSQRREVQKNIALYQTFKSIYKGNYRSAQESTEQALSLLGEEEERAYLELLKCYILIENKELETALDKIEIILSQLRKREEVPVHLLAQGNAYLVTAYSNLKLYNRALCILDELIEITSKNNLKHREALAYQQKGFIYSKHKNYEKALQNYHYSLKLLSGTTQAGPIFVSIIKNYVLSRDYVQAEKYFIQSQTICLTIDEQMTIQSYRAQAELYKGNSLGCQVLIEKPIAFFKENGYKRSLYYIYGFLAEGYMYHENHKQAAYYYELREALNYEH